MNTNGKIFLAITTSTVLAFFGGWLVFGYIFDEYYASNVNPTARVLVKPEPAIGPLFIATLAWSTLLTLLLHKTASITFKNGFITSLWISFCIMLIFDLNVYAFWDIYQLSFLTIDIFVGTLFWALTGGIAGWILGSGKKVIPVT